MPKNPFLDIVEDALNETFEQRLTDEQRIRVATALKTWLQVDAVKKPLPDLNERIKALEKQIDKMAEEMDLVVKDGKLVVKVSGSDESTWTRLRLGTDWFVGNDELMETVMAGVASESPVVKST